MRDVRITIKVATEKPSEENWSYPLDEIPYIMRQIWKGERENGETFILCDNRLYETYETETL